jgi:GNAT superfamily N-acetyltransferase
MALIPVPDTLIVTYLEMTHRDQFRPSFVDDPRIQIVPMGRVDVGYYRFLYTGVGYDLRWRDRLVISEDELRDILLNPNVSVHVLWMEGVPAGYVELEKQGADTEVSFFGLRPGYQGFGYGKHLLSYGLQRAWDEGAGRVWVHTCNMDGAHALANYLKRGFQVYKVEEQPMPDRYKT